MTYKLYFDPDYSKTGTQSHATDGRGQGYDFIHALDSSLVPPEGFVFDCIVLEEDTQPMDFVSLSNPGGHFVVSHRIKLVLEKFKLAQVKMYPVKLFWKGEYLHSNFWLLWFSGNEFQSIDFSKTRFSKIAGWVSRTEEELPLMDRSALLDEYMDTLDSPDESIEVKGTYYFISPISDKDMFRIGEFDDNIYISQNLYQELNSLNPSGIEFMEAVEVTSIV